MEKTEYQKLVEALQTLNSRQLNNLKKFVTLSMWLKRLSQEDLRNYLSEINSRLDEGIRPTKIDDIEVEL